MRNAVPVVFSLILLLLAGQVSDAFAQKRADLPSPYRLTGPTLMQPQQQQESSRLFNFVNVRMGHSYEMTMGSFGGNVYNQNMYTNTLYLDFNESLYGRVDVAFAHSPFGQGLPGSNQTGRVFVRNAELNYAISDRTHLSFQFQQLPPGTGYFGPQGFGHNRFSPYHRRGYDPFFPY